MVVQERFAEVNGEGTLTNTKLKSPLPHGASEDQDEKPVKRWILKMDLSKDSVDSMTMKIMKELKKNFFDQYQL